MYPSRAAPSPPMTTRTHLPLNHPFATYYLPRQHSSSTCVDSTDSLPLTPKTSSYTASSFQISLPSSTHSKSSKQFGSYLAQPLSPRTIPSKGHSRDLGHYTSYSQSSTFDYTPSCVHPAHSRTCPPAQSYLRNAILTEMTLFDHRPRETLLSDVEFVIGKKFKLPFLESLLNKKDNRKGSKRGQGVKLVKEKPFTEDWAFWDTVSEDVIIIDKEEKKRYRGVKEGNWV